MPGGKGPSGSGSGGGKGGAAGVGSCKASDYRGSDSGRAGGHSGTGPSGRGGHSSSPGTCHFDFVSDRGVKVGTTDSGRICVEVGAKSSRMSDCVPKTDFSGACVAGILPGAVGGVFRGGAAGAGLGAVAGCFLGIAGLMVSQSQDVRECVAKIESEFAAENLKCKTAAQATARLREMMTFIYSVESSVHLPPSANVRHCPINGILATGTALGYYNQYAANIMAHTKDAAEMAAAEKECKAIGSCSIS